MRRQPLIALTALAALLAGSLGAETAPATDPAPEHDPTVQRAPTRVSLLVPDLLRSRSRWAQTPYHAMWQATADSPVRAQLGELGLDILAELEHTTWIDPMLILANAERFALHAEMAPAAPPRVQARLTVHDQAKAIWEAIKQQPGGQLDDAGTAVICPTGTTAIDGDTFTYLPPETEPHDYTPLRERFAADDCALRMQAMARRPQPIRSVLQAVAATMGVFDDEMDWTLATRLDEAGSHSTIACPQLALPAMLAPLDPAALAPIPSNALGVIAWGIDGTRATEMVAQWRALAPTIDQAIAANDARAAAAGRDSLTAVLAELDGTGYLVITPGLVVPGLAISLPTGPAFDAWIEHACATSGVVWDSEQARSAPTRLQLPQARLPVAIYARRTADRWIFATNASTIGELAAPEAAGFATAKLRPVFTADPPAGDDDATSAATAMPPHLALAFDLQASAIMARSLLQMRAAFGGGDDLPLLGRLLVATPAPALAHLPTATLRLSPQAGDHGIELTCDNLLTVLVPTAAMYLMVGEPQIAPPPPQDRARTAPAPAPAPDAGDPPSAPGE